MVQHGYLWQSPQGGSVSKPNSDHREEATPKTASTEAVAGMSQLRDPKCSAASEAQSNICRKSASAEGRFAETSALPNNDLPRQCEVVSALIEEISTVKSASRHPSRPQLARTGLCAFRERVVLEQRLGDLASTNEKGVSRYLPWRA